jgi:DNA-binding transcriptional LysR family regulator
MDAADLKVFEAVARLASMGRAAEALHTVQSNVTARIRQLEDALGRVLFHRHARGVKLTQAGQRLLPYALQVARVLQEARRVTLDDGTPKGPLVIGSLETTMALHLTQTLSAFVAVYPDVDLTFQTGTTCELVEQVRDHRLEGAFI